MFRKIKIALLFILGILCLAGYVLSFTGSIDDSASAKRNLASDGDIILYKR